MMSSKEEYSPELCILAGEFRALGMKIPEHIPDCAWVYRSEISWDVKCTEGDVPRSMCATISSSIKGPFRWVEGEVKVAIDVDASDDFLGHEGSGWKGVDLDGTLAEYDGWKGSEHIGAPIPRMMNRVIRWLNKGIEVRIVTARVAPSNKDAEANRPVIERWVKKHFGVELPITHEKDQHMWELWDDRVVQVVKNTGERADGVKDDDDITFWPGGFCENCESEVFICDAASLLEYREEDYPEIWDYAWRCSNSECRHYQYPANTGDMEKPSWVKE